MKKAGCVDLRFGIESGSERVRKNIINKKITDDQIIKAISIVKKNGLIASGFFLFGHPTETFEEMKQTIELAKRCKVDYAAFMIASPIPRSKLFDVALEEGKIPKDIWKQVILGKMDLPVYVPEGVTIEQMEKLQRKANRSFYLRPSYLINQIRITPIRDLFFKAKIGSRLLLARGTWVEATSSSNNRLHV